MCSTALLSTYMHTAEPVPVSNLSNETPCPPFCARSSTNEILPNEPTKRPSEFWLPRPISASSSSLVDLFRFGRPSRRECFSAPLPHPSRQLTPGYSSSPELVHCGWSEAGRCKNQAVLTFRDWRRVRAKLLKMDDDPTVNFLHQRLQRPVDHLLTIHRVRAT